ncbi:hypothetical protein [Phytobacter sp. RSE-02]|uniref:hypothetical protein n=1 Tax=Phytobacter sp. RSE-02 TaxID=3229229 RepID=UPI00339D63F6
MKVTTLENGSPDSAADAARYIKSNYRRETVLRRCFAAGAAAATNAPFYIDLNLP